MTREIIRAIDGGLCSLRVTQQDHDAILRRIRAEGPGRTRRLSAPALSAMAAALLLCVLAAVLLARPPAEDVLIPLSDGTEEVFTPVPMLDPAERVKRFVEEVVMTFALDSGRPDRYTAEETNALLEQAQAWDIALWARHEVVVREAVWRGEAVSRAELILMLCESGLDARYELWPLETQYWLRGTVFAALGLEDGDSAPRLPAEGDLTREEAVEAAQNALARFWAADAARDVADRARYDVGVEFASARYATDEGFQSGDRFWRVSFLPRGLTGRQYALYLTASGEYRYLADGDDVGANADLPDATIRTRFCNLYGDERCWSQETLYAYWQALRESGSTTHRRVMAATRSVVCPDDSAAKISASQAAETAKTKLKEPDALVQSVFLLMDGGAPVWRVWLTTREDELYVEVGALTGVIVQTATLPERETDGALVSAASANSDALRIAQDDPPWEMAEDEYRFYWAVNRQAVIEEVEEAWVESPSGYG